MAKLPACTTCTVSGDKKICRVKEGGVGIASCPTKKMKEAVARARGKYTNPQIKEFARQASIQEGECYANKEARPFIKHPVKPRLQEIIEFSQKMGYHRLGLAYCGGLQAEAAQLHKILEAHGFEVVSAVCKVGGISKEYIGVADAEKVCPGRYETMCNPIAQAEVLNEAKTEFNIAMGLCVGHDSLFFMHVKAPATVFVAKDRVLGHNPVAAVYTSGSYYERFLKK